MINKNSTTFLLKKYLGITLGSLIYAFSTSLFLDPNQLAPGGVLGIAVIVNKLIPVSTGILFFIFNIPLFVYGCIKFGWRMLVSSGYAVLISSVATHFLAYIKPVTSDLLIASLAGAIIQGAGIGIVFKFGATTGGSDIIVKALRMKHKHLNTGTLFFLTDLLVVIASGIVFQNINLAIYALIVVYISGKAMDFILYGSDEARMLIIVSDKSVDISKRIMTELNIGATFLEGKGAYTGKGKDVLLCVAKKTTAPSVEEIVKQVDKDAFLIISNAKEIYGEGYKNILEEKV